MTIGQYIKHTDYKTYLILKKICDMGKFKKRIRMGANTERLMQERKAVRM